MKIVKAINNLFVKLVLVIVYVFGLGFSFLIRLVLNKSNNKVNSFWQVDSSRVEDEVNKEGY